MQAAAEVAVVGERSREERDAELRKRAIDVDEATPRKRPRRDEIETRVAKVASSEGQVVSGSAYLGSKVELETRVAKVASSEGQVAKCIYHRHTQYSSAHFQSLLLSV